MRFKPSTTAADDRSPLTAPLSTRSGAERRRGCPPARPADREPPAMDESRLAALRERVDRADYDVAASEVAAAIIARLRDTGRA